MKLSKDEQELVNYIIRQMLMIEDKLFNTKKKCSKCIYQGLLLLESTIQNLMKEKTFKVYPVFVKSITQLRNIQVLLNKKRPITEAVQGLRTLRKQITKDLLDKSSISKDKVKRNINHKCKSGILPILNPIFNLREAEKNVLLLLDHLLIKDHRCNQCHKKHSLLIEAFLEEASSLDLKDEYKKIISAMTKDIRKVQCHILTGRNKYADAVIILKKMEKKLFPYSMKFLELEFNKP